MHDRNCTAARHRAYTTVATLLAAVALGLTGMVPAGAQNAQQNPEVRVTTNMGSFVIELRPNRAPRTVANFLRYVRTGFYTDTLIHRVVANFIIQGGGHEATPPYALKPTGPPVVNESGNGLENKRGTVGLARGPNPDSGTAQFYINLVDNPELDPLPTRWGYTVFGKVIQGMNVVEHIGVVPTGAFGPFKSEAPLKPVIIKSITLVSPSQAGTPSAGTGTTSTPAGAAHASSSSPHSPPPASSKNGAAGNANGSSGTPPTGVTQSGNGSAAKPAKSAAASPSSNGASSGTAPTHAPSTNKSGGTSPADGGSSSGTEPKPPAPPTGTAPNEP